METKSVSIAAKAKKDLKKVPEYIVRKLLAWVEMIEKYGLTEVKKIPGYHDEPLRGKRKEQHSIRLSKAYRAFYTEYDKGRVELNYIEVIEVNKHEY